MGACCPCAPFLSALLVYGVTGPGVGRVARWGPCTRRGAAKPSPNQRLEPTHLIHAHSTHPNAPPQERLAALADERKKLVDGLVELGGGGAGTSGGGGAPGGATGGRAQGDSAATSAMVEKERHKLEVLKRRQERDIQQVGGGGGPGSRCKQQLLWRLGACRMHAHAHVCPCHVAQCISELVGSLFTTPCNPAYACLLILRNTTPRCCNMR